MAFQKETPAPKDFVVVKRVYGGVKQHFQIRLSEWTSAAIMILWGLLLYMPQDTFALSDTYIGLQVLMTEQSWAFACLTVGSLRFMALTVNGTFHSFKYAAHIRAMSAALSIFVWAQLLWGMLGSGNLTTFVCVYPVLIVADMFNIWFSIGEAGHVDGKRGKSG